METHVVSTTDRNSPWSEIVPSNIHPIGANTNCIVFFWNGAFLKKLSWAELCYTTHNVEHLQSRKRDDCSVLHVRVSIWY